MGIIMLNDLMKNAFERILQPLAAHLPIEAAASVASFELSAEVQERLECLADKSTAGTLTTAEREEYSSFVTALDFVVTFQSLARRLAS
jgi:hypothetical protein